MKIGSKLRIYLTCFIIPFTSYHERENIPSPIQVSFTVLTNDLIEKKSNGRKGTNFLNLKWSLSIICRYVWTRIKKMRVCVCVCWKGSCLIRCNPTRQSQCYEYILTNQKAGKIFLNCMQERADYMSDTHHLDDFDCSRLIRMCSILKFTTRSSGPLSIRDQKS